MRFRFRDPAHQDHFDRFGWVKVPFLSADEVREISARSRDIASTFSEGFTATAVMSREIKATTADIIKSFFAPRIDDLILGDYRAISTALVSKKGIGKGDFPLHQHICYTDETRGFAPLIVWCPLVDTDDSNGNLHVVSGTHRIPKFPRAVYQSKKEDTYYGPACWRIFEERAEAVPMKAGEAIVFENSLIHGSPSSRTDDARLVASAVIVPDEAVTFMYIPEGDGRLAMCAVEEVYSPEDHLLSNRSDKVIGHVDMPCLDGLEQQVFDALGVEPPAPPIQTADVLSRAGIRGWFGRIFGMDG